MTTGQATQVEQSWANLDSVAYQASIRPDRPACLDLRNDEALTYRQLNELVARTAGWLRNTVAEPFGARIATIAKNGLESLVLMYACERVGAIFTPLNWRLTGVELAGLAEDAQPALILFEDEFETLAREAAAASSGTILAAVSGFRVAVDASAPVAAQPGGPDHACVILYTSGTTGRPKGVILTRANVFWGVFNFANVGDVQPSSVMLCETPMFHTVGLVATCRCILYRGGTLLISDGFAPGRTLSRLSDPALGVTHFFGVPQIAQAMVDDPGYAASDLTRLTGLFLGGAPLPTVLAERLMADGILVLNGYGSTEASTVAGVPLDAETARRKMGSAGVSAPVMDIRIVDADGAPLTTGQTGEVWLRGPSLTPGYWNQPTATASAFKDGWYRTGDAGYLDEDGHLFLVDRWKDMYISGGENVYPAEVENAIGLLAGIREVGVVGIPDARWGEVGCAFIVLHDGAALSADAVLAHCRPLIARYKLPARVEFIDALPRTGSGKIRKDELRKTIA